METIKTMQPGEAGTHQLLNRFGERLVCVRYRKDNRLNKRYTTVELIVAERPYRSSTTTGIRVWVNIAFDETDLRKKVKSAGARWLPEEKVWEMELWLASKLGLKSRIVKRLVGMGV